MSHDRYQTGAYQIRNLHDGKVYVGGAYRSSEEFRQEKSELFSSLWEDPEWRAKVEETHRTEEYRQATSARSRRQWEDPTIRTKQSFSLQKNYRERVLPQAPGIARRYQAGESGLALTKAFAISYGQLYRVLAEIGVPRRTLREAHLLVRDVKAEKARRQWEDPVYKSRVAETIRQTMLHKQREAPRKRSLAGRFVRVIP